MKLLGWLLLVISAGCYLAARLWMHSPPGLAYLLALAGCLSVLCGVAFFALFFAHRAGAIAAPLLLTAIQIELTYSSRTLPQSSPLARALTDHLERPVGAWENYYAGWLLLFAMMLSAVAAVWLAGTGASLLTGKAEWSGKEMLRAVLKSLTQWEKANQTNGPNDS